MATSSSGSGASIAHSTSRKDWDELVTELFSGVISGAPFGIGIAAKSKGFLGSTLKLRLNQNFPTPSITAYIRKNFQSGKLDKIFQTGEGLERDKHNLLKVTGEGLGLPRNCLVYPFHNPADNNCRAVIIFGGERLEGQLERRLQTAQSILDGQGGPPKSSPLGLDDPGQLQARLAKINVKRLFEYDLDLLSRIVNSLEHSKEDLPKHLKPIFRTVSEYILKKRLKR